MQLKFFLFCFISLIVSCVESDLNDVDKSYKSSSLLGTECAQGCIWSSYAVSTGVQRLTHYCNGQGCHCVEAGNIYNSCYDETHLESQEVQTDASETILDNKYDLTKGRQIADEAYWEASRRGTVGWCYNAVADAVERVTGRFLWGAHAYQAADQFASSPHFYEVWNRDLRSLPAGAIVVWGKGTSKSGHISVSLGNGQEASDHIASQMTYHYGGAPSRVFLPR